MIANIHRALWLLLVAWVVLATAKKDGPDVEVTTFASAPVNLFYFEDSDVVIVEELRSRTPYRSADGGKTWGKIKDLEDTAGLLIQPHPYDNKVAIAMSLAKTHFITYDQGDSWRKIELDALPVENTQPFVFHASDSKKILFLTADCHELPCTGKATYTKDGGKTLHTLREGMIQCTWAKSTERFTTGDKDEDDDTTICIVAGKYSNLVKDNRLVVSTDYFKTETEPPMESGRNVQGHHTMAMVKGFLVVATLSTGSVEEVLYISDDAKTWHKAVFADFKLESNGYTILESTNYSLQVDVLSTRRAAPLGTLFTSNSNGTYFTRILEHTNRDMTGVVDFEKIQNIQGLVLVNTVDNWKEAAGSLFAEREILTSISFDDGRTWQKLTAGDDHLHLHSVTSQRNPGRIFSSPAPGLVMGVGSTGKYLKEWQECDTYVSDDAGVSWSRALRKPHLYEFGDQGAILVAVEDAETDKVMYSINHGKDWIAFDLDDKIKPKTLQTAPDSTSLKFILVATKGSGSKLEYVTIFLDFAGLHEGQCKDSDFERWPARVNDKGEATCLMGHKQFYRRRKANADCFVDYDFKDPVPEYEECKCTDEDYECDYDFIKSEDGKDCILAGPLPDAEKACKGGAETFKGSSGYRLIPGNVCVKKGGVTKDEPIDRPCKDSQKTPASGKVASEVTTFNKETEVREYYYLQRNADEKGDTVIMQTKSHHVYITHDHGKTWDKVLEDEDIIAIYPHNYFQEVVYLVTASKKIYYSFNQGKHFNSFEVPEVPNLERIQILNFHPKEKDWLIYVGGKDCKSSSNCHSVAYLTTNGGQEWKTLLPYVKKCQFISREDRYGSEKLVFCEQRKDEDPKNRELDLITSEDWYEKKTTPLKNIVSFATMSEFIVVALRDEKEPDTLRIETSLDGRSFAYAKFPPDFHVDHEQAYTVLDSNTHAIFLHVTVNAMEDQEYGSIMKSNSNGTSYVLSADYVNRNHDGFVDFEKMFGLEGVAVINVVANIDDLASGSAKKLRTMITHNDGADWAPIKPPQKDSEGKAYDCKSSSIEQCALHLHGYTERYDPRDTYSSASAVGLMMGVGNVGASLGTYKTGDTFITRDGGITWSEVFKGTWTWEYGDQGSVIVIVKQGSPVKEVYYSRDEGATWLSYQFSDRSIVIEDISTVPADTSRNFLLWGRDSDTLVTVNLDFTGLTDRLCTIDEQNPERDGTDYYLWRPKHPLSDGDCLFGHVAEYHRKKLDSDCYNGLEINHLHNRTKNCECARLDFECDYNYERQKDGSCVLHAGLQPADHSAICKEDPNAVEWYEPTGYRRIPLSTCEGGRELEHSAQRHACPGKEDEYYKKNGIGGVGLFFAIFIPIAAAAGAGYWVWKNWEGQFGRIRLGDTGGMGFSGVDSDSPFIRWPVLAISGIVAVIATIPMLVGSLWRAGMNRFGRGSGYGYNRPYTSRGSFQRGRGDYAVVDEDEGELLGEESDEEV